MLPVNLAILDSVGMIVSVNAGWKAFGRNNGLTTPRFGIGQNYLQYCSTGSGEVRKFGQQVQSVLARSRTAATLIYRCDAPRKKRLFLALAVQLGAEFDCGAALLHVSVSSIVDNLQMQVDQVGSVSRMI